MIRQSVILGVLSAVLGLGINLLSTNRIPYVGDYRTIDPDRSTPIIPPDAHEGDPPFIAVDVAALEHRTGSAVFVDAREPEEFECGTIPGSINIPFDYLPEGDLALYLDSALGGIPRHTPIITFCSGEECDLSLHLGRNLRDFGYGNVLIFFGGSREWEKFGLQMERRSQCGE